MPKRTFRYDRKLDKMVEMVNEDADERQTMVRGDIPAFRSPLDGTMVEGRRAYEEHLRKHNAVPFEAGDEKRKPQKENPTPRRELIWEVVDRSIQQRNRR
jgi:hypothetical protein